MEVKPMENYETPKIPTLEETNANSKPLKKLPKRWKKNVAIAAGVGIIGLSALFGSYMSNRNLEMRIHHGGMGSAAYVVHLTEAEAFRIIRTRLETAGLTFDAEPPAYSADWWIDCGAIGSIV